VRLFWSSSKVTGNLKTSKNVLLWFTGKITLLGHGQTTSLDSASFNFRLHDQQLVANKHFLKVKFKLFEKISGFALVILTSWLRGILFLIALKQL
jgi:hypothetical protein